MNYQRFQFSDTTRYANGEEELYDLKADPNEWSNLTGLPEHAATRKKFAARVSGKD
jgi:hypothetical protein|tara:strand:+ start:177 stop:344 length:168 start_codon:yes stop_codon:yes gene_type:complete